MDTLTLTRRYSVKYRVNADTYEEEFSCFTKTEPEIEINSELSDRYWGDDWEILSIKRIPTPENMKIKGLELYYENEDFLNDNIIIQNG